MKETGFRRQLVYVLIFIVSSSLGASWLLLTRATGLTYHLFPLIIAASVPALPALLFHHRLTPSIAAAMAGLGLAIVGVSWMIMRAGGFAPTAGFVDGQPGGVVAEVVLLGVLGAVWGVRYATRAR